MRNVADFINSFALVYSVAILVALAFRWIDDHDRAWVAGFRSLVDQATAPYLRPFCRLFPPIGRLDLAPLVAILALQVAGAVAAGVVGEL